MTRSISTFVFLALIALASPLSAQEAATGYAAVGEPGVTTLEEAVLAWDAGDVALARLRAREARRAAPNDQLARLVDVAIATNLDPHLVLELDATARGVAIDELREIDAQRETAHIVGIVSGAVGLIAIFVALSLPALIQPMCSLGCEDMNPFRFGGGLAGIGALIGGGVAIGMHVDAGGWTERWADGRRASGPTLSLGPTSITIGF